MATGRQQGRNEVWVLQRKGTCDSRLSRSSANGLLRITLAVASGAVLLKSGNMRTRNSVARTRT
eukprot:2462596-Pleurochrysis_carterae.AAC.1